MRKKEKRIENKPEQKKSYHILGIMNMLGGMFWALVFTELLDGPDHICNVLELANTVKDFSSFEELIEKSNLHTTDEIKSTRRF